MEQWIREGFSSYYVVKKEQKLTYEKNILCYHTLSCLLPCEFRIQDEEEYYYYETGIYTKLKDRIQMLEPRLFFAFLLEAFEELESYLLELDHLKLEPEFLFLDKEDRPVLCYLPEYEKNIFDQLRDFLEECIEMLPGNDKKKIRFYYEFHSFLIREKPNMEQMKKYLEIPTSVESAEIEKSEEALMPIKEMEESTRNDQVNVKNEKRKNNLLGKIIFAIIGVIGSGGMIYFVIQIFKYGFYYLFMIGAVVSLTAVGISVYGSYRLWKKQKNRKENVDFYEEKENLTTLLDDKTTLLDDDKTVLLMEEPIGRLEACDRDKEDITINDNGFIIGSSIEGTDHQLEGTGISRRHVRFYKENGKVYCEDLESTNGVKINGRKIQRIALKNGDQIKIGLEEFIFREV